MAELSGIVRVGSRMPTTSNSCPCSITLLARAGIELTRQVRAQHGHVDWPSSAA